MLIEEDVKKPNFKKSPLPKKVTSVYAIAFSLKLFL
jgi:hypothetical protein